MRLSINDRVAAVSEVFDDVIGGHRFAALVPEPLLRDGDNDPRLFLLTGDGDEADERELRELDLEPGD